MTTSASSRGWGPGWPHDNSSKGVWVTARRSGCTVSVDYRIAPIVQFLMDETERLGYLLDLGPKDPTDDWGGVNRPIRGTSIASNHSWWLAIDLDASKYPQGQTKAHLPQWVMDLWLKYGFDNGVYWHNPDPMHMEFNGTPNDAKFLVASLAAHAIEGTRPPLPPSAKPDPVIAVIATALNPLLEEDDDMPYKYIRNAAGSVYLIFKDGTKKAVPGNGTWPVLQDFYQGVPTQQIDNEQAFNLLLAWHPTRAA